MSEARAEVEGARVVMHLPLPPDILRPNRIGGANKYAVTRARREARSLACHMAVWAWHDQPLLPRPGGSPLWSPCPVWPRVRASVTFRGVRGRMDADNAYGWLKNVRDGISDALCGGDDHGWEWDGEPAFVRGEPGVTITVAPVEGSG